MRNRQRWPALRQRGLRRLAVPLTALAVPTALVMIWWMNVPGPALALAAGIGALSVTLTAAIILHRRTAKAISNIGEQLGHLWGLLPLIPKAPPLLPPLGGYSLDATKAHALLNEVLSANPGTVVELGAGSSTVLLGLLQQSTGARFTVYGVEHDAKYARQVTTRMGWLPGARWQLVLAPLEQQTFGKWTGQWYGHSLLRQLPEQIDFLFVDGPPAFLQRYSRYPALPALAPRLSEGAIVFVDDVDRREERAILHRWLRDLPALSVQHDAGCFVVMRMGNPR